MSLMKHSFPLIDSRTGIRTSLSEGIQTSQPISWGLWSPEGFPQFSDEQVSAMSHMNYQWLAHAILSRFDFGVSENELSQIISEAYWNQWHNEDITPVKQIGDRNLHSLHLGYGPTFAFKNVALEFLPRLLSRLVTDRALHVLWASSGDTINAAHSGVKWTNINSMFMLPNKWPSYVQALQAKNGISHNPNALTFLADQPFDPLQDIVKKINKEEFQQFKQENGIISFNSINIARILAQVVYYFRAYSQLLANGNVKSGEEVIFSVPSGNFGDALAGYYAKKMGLPIKTIHIATNENNMLERFFQTGTYEPPKDAAGKDYVWVTNAPSMDIAKSSNFERMLFDITGNDYERVEKWYKDLNDTGKFQVDDETLGKIQKIFTSSSSTDNQRLSTIKEMSDAYQHWIDPHTAAGVQPFLSKDSEVPVIFLETSHVAQFGKELEAKGLIVPGMNEFDETIRAMEKNTPIEGRDFVYISGDFDEAFKQVKRGIREIFPAKQWR